MTTTSYAFDNAGRETGARFGGLEAALDPLSIRHLSALALSDGARCLEIGAGGGSIAQWLSDRVGETGNVVATDVNLDWFTASAPNIDAQLHDIVRDPLPSATYDVIHARLVLCHLPERDEIILRLVDALRPDGWLVLEEFHAILAPCDDEPTERERLVNRVHAAVVELLIRHGHDVRYPRRLPWQLRNAGLVDVGGSGNVNYETGGSAAAQVFEANIRQVGDECVTCGLATGADITAYLDALRDPDLILHLPLFVSAWGRRP